jgi:succinyl-diaminopimelate desuccinylase
MSDLHETLRTIVDIRSEIGNEGRLCTALEERMLATWGREGVSRIGNSIVVGKRTGRPLVSIYGHIDTVPAQGQGDATVVNGRLSGLGSSDMKAGVAVMLHLMEDPAVAGGPYDVVGVFYDKEEGPFEENGLGPVLQQANWLASSDFAVVMEPTDNELHLGCQGVANATIAFVGHAAHSSRPWLGDNAITRSGEFLTAMYEWENETVEVGGLSYTEVFSVTMALGGVARNIIPDRFELALNYRFPPDRSMDEAIARLHHVAAAADEITIVDAAPGGSVDPDNPYLVRLAGFAETTHRAKQGWTDVARLTAAGVPAVNYGPGETEQAHQVGESVELANLDRSYQVMRSFLTEA